MEPHALNRLQSASDTCALDIYYNLRRKLALLVLFAILVAARSTRGSYVDIDACWYSTVLYFVGNEWREKK